MPRSALLFVFTVCASSQTMVTTAQYDNQRTGANLHETLLTPRSVTQSQFGKLFVIPVDGDVYAQPLYVPNLEIRGKGSHNVVFVATEHDSVYALDAAGKPTEPLWKVSFINPAAGIEPVPNRATQCSFIAPENGITSTPVIDPASRTMYVLVRTAERVAGEYQPRYFQRLHALDIATGAERPGSPVLIRASFSGSRLFGLLHSEVAFHALYENARAALLLANGQVYIAWGSACDAGTYYGWVMAYDARTLKQTAVFNAAPDSGESGIWQADPGIATDTQGSVYAITGNGKFNAASGGRDYGDSVLKLGLRGGGLSVSDYFTPYDESTLNSKDNDLGSSGPVLLPDQPGPHPHLLVSSGKAGVIYLIDRDRMGKFHAGSDSHAVQTLKGAGTSAFGAPAWWNGHLYYFGSNDVLKDFVMDNGKLNPTPAHVGSFQFKDPGAIPSISANGAKDGVVWLVISKGWRDRDMEAMVQAYDAADVGRMLYTSQQDASGAGAGRALRFTIPTVADGRVYVGMRNSLYVYGLLNSGGSRKSGKQ